MTVIGIDLSLTSTGLASIQADGTIDTHSVTSKGTRGDTLQERHKRLEHLAYEITQWVRYQRRCPEPHVVIEAPSFSSSGSGTWDRAGLWWLVLDEIMRDGRGSTIRWTVAGIAPTTRAKWATGTGRGDKAAVGAALSRLLPTVEIRNADEADAVALAHVGAVALGYPVPTLSARHGALPAAVQHWAAAAAGGAA